MLENTTLKDASSPCENDIDALVSNLDITKYTLELTTRCNLRCTYCRKSQDYFDGGCDMDSATVQKILRSITRTPGAQVCVNGHGESTIYPRWEYYSAELIRSGAYTMIISNLAKKFSDDELYVLSHFTCIEVSVDTYDPELFAQMRRGASLQRVLENMRSIRSFAERENRKSPNFSWSCVLSDKNIGTMNKYFQLGMAMGVMNFNICNLTKYPDLPGTLALLHPAQMDPAMLSEVTTHFMRSVHEATDAGARVIITPGLSESISAVLEAWCAQQPIPDFVNPERSDLLQFNVDITPGMTRQCLDPWQMVLVQESGGVAPCCVDTAIDTLDTSESLDEVFNNDAFVRRRKSLLTGRLPKKCMQCTARRPASVKEFRRDVAAFLQRPTEGV